MGCQAAGGSNPAFTYTLLLSPASSRVNLSCAAVVAGGLIQSDKDGMAAVCGQVDPHQATNVVRFAKVGGGGGRRAGPDADVGPHSR